ncbi:MAG: hypothetical protein HFI63_11165 [Lachnospiraceae bacterium]|nr:hypothetical protein [Lachnospiraceae bacterium]
MDATIDCDWEKLEKDFPPQITENKDGSITQESSFASDTLTSVPDNIREGEGWVNLEGMTLEEMMAYFGVSTKEELLDSGIIENEKELQRILDSKRDLVGLLIGYTDLSMVEDFADNASKLESGRFPEQDNECMVSSKYEEHNNLNIGDTICISGPSKSDTETISLIITGGYTAHRAQASAETLGDIYGHVYTTFHTLKNSGFHDIWMGNVVYQLGNPEEAELFEKELHKKGLSEYRILSYSNSGDEYTQNTEPLKNISRIAEIFTLTAGISGAVILFLISFFNVREKNIKLAYSGRWG